MNVSCMNCSKNMRLVNKSQSTGNSTTQSEFHCDVCSHRIKIFRQGARNENEPDDIVTDEQQQSLTDLIKAGWVISHDGDWYILQDPDDKQYAGTTMESALEKVRDGEHIK